MIEGILLINLDPPYIAFSQAPQSSQNSDSKIDEWRPCSVDEIRQLLIELDAILPHHPWPPQEIVLRLPITLPKSELARLSLLKLRNLESVPVTDEPVLRLIS